MSDGGEPSGGPTRFMILGGFLGAGKTTLAVRLGRLLKEEYDKSVAIITNDQGDVLVDTEFTKEAGFDVREVLGGCFCANFDDFVKNARSLVQMSRPDVIIAEPIGTSTNILASVVAPLRTLYPDEFEVAPLTVVVDGTQALGLLEGGEREGTTLIPSHQVKEAECLVLSKVDRLPESSLEPTMEALHRHLNGVEVIPYSSVTGENLDTVLDLILSDRVSRKMPTGADQSTFAGEKASLGWYSSSSTLLPSGKVDLYDLVTSVMRKVADSFDASAVAHVKVVVRSPSVGVKVSLVGNSMQVDGLSGSRYLEEPGSVVVNARVISSPEHLSGVLRDIIDSLEEEMPLSLRDFEESCFTPRPEAPSYFFKQV
ncbi:MAG: GTP-binding protein [Methanomassiliicoccales archaeon]